MRQGQAGFGLVGVGGTAHALVAAQADLVMHAQVRLQVIGGQGDHLAALEHVEVHLDGAQCQRLGGAKGVIGARVNHRLGACYFVGGVETVKQHLPQAQFRRAVGQGFLVVSAWG